MSRKKTGICAGCQPKPVRAPCVSAGLRVLALAGILAASGVTTAQNGGPRELVLLNWSEYLDEDVKARFEKQYNAVVKLSVFATDSDRDRIVSRAEPGDFDLAVVDAVSTGLYRKSGWIAPIPADRIENLQHLDSRWRIIDESGAEYSVPYFWGTIGIGYRPDLVSSDFSSWMDLFRPTDELCGKILVVDDSVDVIAIALKALGYSPFSRDSSELKAVSDLLTEQQKCVTSYGSPDLNQHSDLVSGVVAAAMLFNGDIATLRQYEPRLSYVIPREGGAIWVDHLVVFQGSRRKSLAFDFINFINDPRNAAQNAKTVTYAPANKAAEAYLPKWFLEDPVIFPEQSALDHSSEDRYLPPRTRKERTRIFFEVKNATL